MIDRQKAAPAGPGYAWSSTGPCANSWREEQSGACVHADFSVGGGVVDGTEVYDLDYLAELPTAVAPTAGYCNDATSNKVRVLYAWIPANGNRFTDLKDTLKGKSERADYWLWKSAKQQDGKRHFRYVCGSAGEIAIVSVELPNWAKNSFSDMVTALRNAGYNATDPKFLVFADFKDNSVADPDDVCGRGSIFNDTSALQTNDNNGGNMHAGVYLRAANCTDQWGHTAFHELGHVMGSLAGDTDKSPRFDDQNPNHPRDEHDVMAYGGNTYIASTCTEEWKEKRYDCGKNDYFSLDATSTAYVATHWNVATNKFLVGGGPL